MINNNKNLYLGVLLCSGLLLAGCQNNQAKTAPKTQQPVTTVPTPPQQVQVNVTQPAINAPAESRTTKIDLCQSELASLKQINPRSYALKKAQFDSLVSNASVYGSVRSDVNAQTKDTLDALYKYKTNQVCADIQREVLQGLIQRGESLK